MNRYEAFKKGDYTYVANPIPAESSNAQPLSLIDFDDAQPEQPTIQPTPANDLAGLFATPSPPQVTAATSQPSVVSPFTAAFGASSGAPSFSSFAPSQPQPFAPQPQIGVSNPTGSLFGHVANPPHLGSTATPPAAIRLGGTPTLGSSSGSPAPNYFGNSSFSKGPVAGAGAMAPLGAMQTSSHSPPALFPQQAQTPTAAPPAAPAAQQQQKDPFADLAGLF